MKPPKIRHRQYGSDLKQHILGQCTDPGASVACIAMSHSNGADVAHKWHRSVCGILPVVLLPAFVPVPLHPAARAIAPVIRVASWLYLRLADLATLTCTPVAAVRLMIRLS